MPWDINPSLTSQCKEYGLSIETFPSTFLHSRSWSNGRKEVGTPEEIVLSEYCHRGYKGAWCEGGTLILLMKTLCFPILTERIPSSQRQYARFSLFHNDCKKLASHQDKIIVTIEKTTNMELNNNAAEILSDGRVKREYPNVSTQNILGLWNALGSKKLIEIIHVFLENPDVYKAGWPDLTLTLKNDLRFIEVKTTDCLHQSQVRILHSFAKRLDLPFSIAHVAPK